LELSGEDVVRLQDDRGGEVALAKGHVEGVIDDGKAVGITTSSMRPTYRVR
jgi:hypothetical protein